MNQWVWKLKRAGERNLYRAFDPGTFPPEGVSFEVTGGKMGNWAGRMDGIRIQRGPDLIDDPEYCQSWDCRSAWRPFTTASGNQSDDRTHCQTWDLLGFGVVP